MATDLIIGQPIEFALKSCAFSVRLGQLLGFTTEQLRETFYGSLLRYIGCNAEAHLVAALFGDEMELRRDLAANGLGGLVNSAGIVWRAARRAHAHVPALSMIAGIINTLARAHDTGIPVILGHCEVAQQLARRLGLGAEVSTNLGQLYARWDGKGLPRDAHGEAIAPAVRVVTIVQDLIVLSAVHGTKDALQIVKKRRGYAYDPRVVDRLLAESGDVLSGLGQELCWDAVLALEPPPHAILSAEEIDEACRVIADFTDVKAPFTLGHSRAVAALAEAAGRECGLPQEDRVALRRAGLVHDLGDAAVPATVWIKPGPFSESEWEKVRLHAYYTERILARPQALGGVRRIAGMHHERLDGSGYHRGAKAAEVSPSTRILAAAEAYQTKIEARPHRPAQSAASAETFLRQEVRAGRLDGAAAAAVLAVAGHRVPVVRRQLVAGLTARELSVLRLLARGQTIKQIAGTLDISAKTAGNHVQNLYGKIEVSTRAGATMFAIAHGLIGEDES